MKRKIYAVGLGPGSPGLITPDAVEAIRKCDTVAGYVSYIKMMPELFAGKKIISNGMRGEVERCELALDAALDGADVAVVSSGDPGIYAMAGLLMELTEKEKYAGISVEVVPGVTAATAAAAALGAPLMNDFAVVSLSNLMTPDEIILKRLKAVADADMVCVLYNPASKKRRKLIVDAVDIFRRRLGDDAFAGIVTNAARPDETAKVATLGDFPFDEVGMSTVVVIGDSQTVFRNGKLHTPRGYKKKYEGK